MPHGLLLKTEGLETPGPAQAAITIGGDDESARGQDQEIGFRRTADRTRWPRSESGSFHHQTRRRDRSRQRLRSTVAAGAAVVVLLLLAPGLGVGASGPALSPPFKGSFATITAYHYPAGATGCGNAGFGHRPSWSPKLGELNWSGGASLRSSAKCTSPIIYCGKNSTCVYTDITLTVPIPSPRTSGTHTIRAYWTLRANDSWALVPHPCPAAVLTNGSGYQACSMLVTEFFDEVFVFLDDVTTGALYRLNASISAPFSFANTSSYFHDESCTSNVCVNRTFATSPASGASSVSRSLVDTWSSVPLNSSDRYELSYRILGGVSTDMYVAGQPWASTAHGWMDVNSSGNGLYLTLISIS